MVTVQWPTDQLAFRVRLHPWAQRLASTMAHSDLMAAVPAQDQRKSKYQPWYKERLELKYMRTNPKSAALNGKKWTFVRSDMDDLRSGVPVSMTEKDMVIKGRDDIIPVIDSALDVVGVSSSRGESRLGRYPVKEALKQSRGGGQSTLYTRVGPRRQIQSDRLNGMMQKLCSHPLALYPHLEEAIPAELVDDVVGLLDPDLQPTSSEAQVFSQVPSPSLGAVVEEDENGIKSSDQMEGEGKPSESDQDDPLDEEVCGGRESIYRQPMRRSDVEEAEAEAEEMTRRKVVSPSQMSRVKNVTQDLCQWMRELKTEDDQNCLEEGTIQNLFASDPETMAENLVPFQVVELGNIPEMLRDRYQSRNNSASSSGRGNHQQWPPPAPSEDQSSAVPVPSKLVRTKYGAWYLPPRTWKLRRKDEPLRDPNETTKETETPAQLESRSLDESLMNAHGSKAFKQFVATEKQGANMPYFLKDVVLPSKPTGAASSSQQQTQHS